MREKYKDEIVYNYRMTEDEHITDLKARLIELSSLKKIKEDLKNSNKA